MPEEHLGSSIEHRRTETPLPAATRRQKTPLPKESLDHYSRHLQEDISTEQPIGRPVVKNHPNQPANARRPPMKPPSTLANRPNGQSRSQTSAPDNCLPPSPHRNKNIDRLGTGRLKRSNAPPKPKAQTSASERRRASSTIGRDPDVLDHATGTFHRARYPQGRKESNRTSGARRARNATTSARWAHS